MNLQNKLYELIENWESETVEFKEANDNFSTSVIGQYFSALSNEANLKKVDSGWLIFGVRNADHVIIGTDYRNDEVRLQNIKHQMTQITHGYSFVNVNAFEIEGKRVVMKVF
ncbi:MAG: ATP-binding protein [Candidatus Ancillula sp.]|jgi:ATP-dependent DNA helicase RecG|nr:ATP-binding protein [Candidatus Ancillula sp.]